MQEHSQDAHLGAETPAFPTAHESQRTTAKTGEYLCEACRTRFSYSAGAELCCPNCKNKVTDSLTPFYIENDPDADEMLSRDEFSAGD